VTFKTAAKGRKRRKSNTMKRNGQQVEAKKTRKKRGKAGSPARKEGKKKKKGGARPKHAAGLRDDPSCLAFGGGKRKKGGKGEGGVPEDTGKGEEEKGLGFFSARKTRERRSGKREGGKGKKGGGRTEFVLMRSRGESEGSHLPLQLSRKKNFQQRSILGKGKRGGGKKRLGKRSRPPVIPEGSGGGGRREKKAFCEWKKQERTFPREKKKTYRTKGGGDIPFWRVPGTCAYSGWGKKRGKRREREIVTRHPLERSREKGRGVSWTGSLRGKGNCLLFRGEGKGGGGGGVISRHGGTRDPIKKEGEQRKIVDLTFSRKRERCNSTVGRGGGRKKKKKRGKKTAWRGWKKKKGGDTHT